MSDDQDPQDPHDPHHYPRWPPSDERFGGDYDGMGPALARWFLVVGIVALAILAAMLWGAVRLVEVFT